MTRDDSPRGGGWFLRPAAFVSVRAGRRSVCERCLLAVRPWTRMRGLLGRAELPPGEGILLRPASSIHTFFMRFTIDVVFLDADGVVISVHPSVRPWRTARQKGARAVLELGAGEADEASLRAGERLELVPARAVPVADPLELRG